MIFYIQLIVSFLVGGLFIALQTLIAERVSTLWRGVVLTIPSTLALGLFFIGLAKSPQDVVEASQIVPIALGIDYPLSTFKFPHFSSCWHLTYIDLLFDSKNSFRSSKS